MNEHREGTEEWLELELDDLLDEDFELELEAKPSAELLGLSAESRVPSIDRAGVERVMGFASPEQVEQFFNDVPEFERMLVRSGIVLIKYWFSITDKEQQMRFLMRIRDPMKQWKLSPMDLQSRVRWEDYTRAKEEMLERTNIKEAPWFIVEGNDKKRARLNTIDHLLKQLPYDEVPHEAISLPERVFNTEYERKTLPTELFVPKVY